MKINNSSLRNSAEITQAIFDNYYPNGQMVVKNTSFATEGNYNRTLTSRTISDSLAGDAIYRDPKFALTFYNKTVNSSLNSLITGGSDVAFNSPTSIKIKDPEALAGEGESVATLVGGAALNRIIGTSIVSRQGGQDLVGRSARLTNADVTNARKDPEYLAGIAHGDNSYSPDGGMITTGSRTIALASDLTAEEKAWIIERGTFLKQKSVVSDPNSLTNGFQFDIENGLDNLTQTETYFDGMQAGNSVEKNLIDSASQLAYIAPALIELLIFLESKTGFKGSLSTDRASNKALQNLEYSSISSGSSLNDHVFGRAFDLTEISSRDGSVSINFATDGQNLEKYRNGLNHFLQILNSAPQGILPDLITVHSDLGAELGIVAGNETVEAAVKVQYPNLKFVNFAADNSHKTNIHFSFSAQRSGQYVGPNGALGTPGQFLTPTFGGSDDPLSTVAPGTPPNLNIPKFRENYQNKRGEALTKQEIFDLLRGTIMSDEAAAIFVAVSVRESGSKPAVFNPRTLDRPNARGGDWSVGMFQVNLLTNAHGTKTFYLPVGNRTKTGWQLGYKNWQQDGVNADNFNSKVQSLWMDAAGSYSEKVNRLFPVVDPDCWVPLNQAQLAYTAITGQTGSANIPLPNRLGATAETGYLFYAWGDYGGGPSYGFISNVDFKDAVDIYATSGKNPVLLKRWTLTMFDTAGKNSKSYQYARKWVTGTYFKSTLEGNTFAPAGEEKRWTEAQLYPNPGGASSGGGSGGGSVAIPGGVPGLVPVPNVPVPSTGVGGLNVPNLQGFKALNFARTEVYARRPYCSANPFRDGTPWAMGDNGEGVVKNDRGVRYQFPPGTITYDCSGFVIAVYRQAGLNFTESPYNIYSSGGFATSNLPNAPQDALQPLDIVVYDPLEGSSVGHVLIVNAVKPDGTVETLESTGAQGTTMKTLNRDRIRACKRVFPTGYFNFNPGDLAIT